MFALFHLSPETPEIAVRNDVQTTPPWDRIKERCGIPTTEPWSYAMRMKYHEQIEKQILIDKKH